MVEAQAKHTKSTALETQCVDIFLLWNERKEVGLGRKRRAGEMVPGSGPNGTRMTLLFCTWKLGSRAGQAEPQGAK